MLTKLRRSFRRKKASYCVNCGHVERACYHQEYENVEFQNGSSGSASPNPLSSVLVDDNHQVYTLNNRRDLNNGGTMVASELRWLPSYGPEVTQHDQLNNRVNRNVLNTFDQPIQNMHSSYDVDDPCHEVVYSLPQVKVPNGFYYTRACMSIRKSGARFISGNDS